VYCHALATWDELSPEKKKKVMGFQINTITHTKVIKLERNALFQCCSNGLGCGFGLPNHLG
jgi:hypothetical protein